MYPNKLSTASYSAGSDITDKEFQYFKKFIYDKAGISISDAKKNLVTGRLAKRIRHHNLNSYSDYLKLLSDPKYEGENQVVVDLLTTNETYFFREHKHFDFLEKQIAPSINSATKLRVWCAAASSGEEPYTISMVLDHAIGNHRWELLASDISTRVLERARRGVYPDSAVEKIPPQYLHKYCLKGVRSQSGNIIISKHLRKNITFRYLNLVESLPDIGKFDIIFLRNVMIYFDANTKRQTVHKLLRVLKPGGYFLVSHAESLHNISHELKLVSPSVYRKL